MDAERARAFLLTLPHVVETHQWGDNLVFWVGDKAIGGKMFCLLNLDTPGAGPTRGVISYSAGAERYPELLEREGLIPAPYMARIFWVAAERWSAWRHGEWEAELRAARELTRRKLPAKVIAVLDGPERERSRLIAVQRKARALKQAQLEARK